MSEGTGLNSRADIDKIFEAIEAAGYSYDVEQDIFYSHMEAWQRSMGYCRLYDEAAAPLNMIIDCEPIYFKYDGKKWLIELWKGQYALTTGCEVGVFNTKGPNLKIPGIFEGTFYHSASDAELLQMSCTLKKNNQVLFTRSAKHWWLTGFILGEFSEPWELTLDVDITLIDETMLEAFVEGLKNAGYLDSEIFINGKTVSLNFAKPRTPQPFTRTAKTDAIIQLKNKKTCEMYQDITGAYDDFLDKLQAVYTQSPEMYDYILNIGKTKRLFEKFMKIQKYLR